MSGGKLFHTRSSSERPVTETAAGPVDSERSSVSRTQFSGAYITNHN